MKRKIRKYRVCGQMFEEHLVRRNHPRLAEDGGEDLSIDGHTYLDKNRIYLADDMSRDREDNTRWHELFHVLFDVTGANHLLHEGIQQKDDTSDVEERLIRVLVPALQQLLSDHGFRWKRPK